MQLNDFHFDLPDCLIARYPAKNRSESRLLCIEGDKTDFSHRVFRDMIDLLQPGDLLVANDTRVVPARIFAHKTTGGKVELLVERVQDHAHMLAQLRVSKPPHVGDQIVLDADHRLTVVGREGQFYQLRFEHPTLSMMALIHQFGEIPLPPYMARAAEASDKERYQTVYAREDGSVAAPTAGLHFDAPLLEAIKAKGVEIAYVTLHIGAGTFASVRVQDIREHTMHAEYLQVTEDLCEKIRATKAAGKRVVAVGTTSLRALESASQSGEIKAYDGDTRIFIYPGYTFKTVDALITNLHLPCSTLMMLVSAFGGHARMMSAYQVAVQQAYRFYSYGDAMWIDPARRASPLQSE